MSPFQKFDHKLIFVILIRYINTKLLKSCSKNQKLLEVAKFGKSCSKRQKLPNTICQGLCTITTFDVLLCNFFSQCCKYNSFFMSFWGSTNFILQILPPPTPPPPPRDQLVHPLVENMCLQPQIGIVKIESKRRT